MTIVMTDEAPSGVTNIKARASGNSLKQEAHVRQRHWHRAAPGVTQDDIRHPDYWGRLVRQLHRHDIITVLADDETWELEIVVERVLDDGARVSVRKAYKRETVAEASMIVDANGEFYAEWVPGKSWCIVRKKDGLAVVQGHSERTNAVAEWRRTQPKKVI